jgi:DNA-binding HxlR family transcriptional regulator
MVSNAYTISQENVTTNMGIVIHDNCPAEDVLKMLSGKWKPQILFYLAIFGEGRFSNFQKRIVNASKQSLTVALRELEEDKLVERTVIKQKPLHVEYRLSERGTTMVNAMKTLESAYRFEEQE